MIVVCPNTVVSKLVFDWIAGAEVEKSDGTTALVPGKLALLTNVVDGELDARVSERSSIDSVQLESGEPLGTEFKKDAAHEIDAFKQRLPPAQPRRRRRQARPTPSFSARR